MTKEEAIQILSTRDAHGVLCGYTSGVTEALDMAIEALSAERIGEWIYITNPIGEEICVCSECEHIKQQGYGEYCGHCGAKMEE